MGGCGLLAGQHGAGAAMQAETKPMQFCDETAASGKAVGRGPGLIDEFRPARRARHPCTVSHTSHADLEPSGTGRNPPQAVEADDGRAFPPTPFKVFHRDFALVYEPAVE